MPKKGNCYFIATSWNDSPVSCHFKVLSKTLAERGHQVVILVDGNKYESVDVNGNPSIYTWPSRRPVKMRDARFLIRLIWKYRPNCLIANFGASNLMMMIGWLMSVPCRAGWYHTISSAIELDTKTLNRRITRWKLRALRWRKRLVYLAATNIIPASEAALVDVGNIFNVPAAKCRVFYNSLADPRASQNYQARSSSSSHKLACVGRLFPTKGQDVLIRALPRLKQSVPNTIVEFIGGGPDEDYLRQLAETLGVKDMCHFLGSIPHHEVMAHVQMAAATVVPSRSDNNPLVVIESLALGVPVVASCVGGIVESIDDGVEGFLVAPEDPQALAIGLTELLLDDNLRQEMGHRARERYLAQFEQSKIVSEQARWFEDIAAGARKS